MSSSRFNTTQYYHQLHFTVFDQVKPFSSSLPNPDSLISSLDSLISKTEYSHSTILEYSTNQHVQHQNQKNPNLYDADEAYKSACAALASGRYEDAASFLRIAIDTCPSEKVGAVKKLKSLMDIATSQLNSQVS